FFSPAKGVEERGVCSEDITESVAFVKKICGYCSRLKSGGVWTNLVCPCAPATYLGSNLCHRARFNPARSWVTVLRWRAGGVSPLISRLGLRGRHQGANAPRSPRVTGI